MSILDAQHDLPVFRQAIRDWLAEAAAIVRARRPEARVGAYVGSWYSSYYDVGVNWAFAPNWSLVGGYRVVAASGIALGDNQIPQFFADEAGWKEVKTNGNLILHGAFAGIEARF